MSNDERLAALVRRINQHIDRHAPNGCWTWTGAKDALGYGRVRVDRKTQLAHRVCYETFTGRLIGSLVIDHLCRNPSCVNPLHMEVVTLGENTRRGNAPKRARERQITKTHCPHGHPYDEVNTYVRREGWRQCRACIRNAHSLHKENHACRMI